MIKYLAFAVLALAETASFSQSLKKGNVVGLHVTAITLKPGRSMDDFKEFYLRKVIPAFEKQYPDVKHYLIRGLRGESENTLGTIYFFQSDNIRSRYFNTDGTRTPLGEQKHASMKSIEDELDEWATITREYTDWVIE
jgi:hypothetical protein